MGSGPDDLDQALAALQLGSADAGLRRAAAQALLDAPNESYLPLIERALGAELSHHLGYRPGAAKPEDGLHNVACSLVRSDIGNKTTVDLDNIERQLGQRRQARMAAAEVGAEHRSGGRSRSCYPSWPWPASGRCGVPPLERGGRDAGSTAGKDVSPKWALLFLV